MPTLTDAPVAVVGRFKFPEPVRKDTLQRQLAWILGGVAAAGALAWSGWQAGHPVAATGLALGIAVTAAHAERWVLAPVLPLACVFAALVGDSAGAPILAAGAVAGLGSAWLGPQPLDRWRGLQGGLAGAAGAGLGAWASSSMVPDPGTAWWLNEVSTQMLLVLGIAAGASGALWAAALTWHSAARIPTPGRIKATLQIPYQEPCLRAWQLDNALAGEAPDPDTRDGIGEVAAWVYRLHFTLQALDSEISPEEDAKVRARIAELEAQAQDSSDEFTKERCRAAADHLRKLSQHRDQLTLERGRTAALAEYAGAYLEEARAGLALARMQPGEHIPDRLDDVLGRLRSGAVEGVARRQTAREITSFA